MTTAGAIRKNNKHRLNWRWGMEPIANFYIALIIAVKYSKYIKNFEVWFLGVSV